MKENIIKFTSENKPDKIKQSSKRTIFDKNMQGMTFGNTIAEARGKSIVHAYEDSHVDAFDYSTVHIYDNATFSRMDNTVSIIDHRLA